MARLLLLMLFAMQPSFAITEELPNHREQELKNLVHQDCGSCHGMKLTGGLGPALIGKALEGKSPESLAVTIREGRLGTPMPPWKTLLTETEINWVVDYLIAFEEQK